MALFAIGFMASGENGSDDDVAETAYQAGYEMGFRMAGVDYDEIGARMVYSEIYGSPQTDEESEMYRLFEQNYERGYRDAQNADGQ